MSTAEAFLSQNNSSLGDGMHLPKWKSDAQSDLYKLSVSFEAFACLLSPSSVI